MVIKDTSKENISLEDLLVKIDDRIGGQIVTWKNVDDAIEKNIEFTIIVSCEKYISKEEQQKIKQRSLV